MLTARQAQQAVACGPTADATQDVEFEEVKG
jgi:hypothetical protein